MLGRLRNSFAEVDLTALEQNYLSLQAALKTRGGTGFMAPMVKADGYGHGDIQVARVCERLGARFLGVALIEEGIKLRLAGIQTPILVFAPFDSLGAETLVKYRLTPVLSQFEQFQKLKNALTDEDAFAVHVKFNTGMQRLGFEPAEAAAVAREFVNRHYLKLEGVCTHFASSEDFGDAQGATAGQMNSFSQIMADIKNTLQQKVLYHYLNSAAILSGLEPQLDVARPGIALYGAYPKLQRKPLAEVKPVMKVKSFVAFTHNVKKGAKVSYGGTWQAARDSVIGVVPLGYADGVPRSLSNKGQVLVRGRRCPITGIVCMDYFMIDLTDAAQVPMVSGIPQHGTLLGEEVVVMGQQGTETIRAEDVAAWAGTIPYEIMTGLQTRLPRIYIH